MPEFARALCAVAQRYGPPRAVVAHSLGAAATTLAANWGMAAERFALLAPAGNPAAFAEEFARHSVTARYPMRCTTTV
jgi:hypothetical protein